MQKIGVFTIASKNYLAYVRVLMESITSVHPEYERFLCLADKTDGMIDSATEGYQIVEADRLDIPDFEDMTLRYDIMEFNTAVKPFMIQWLFQHTELDAVIYLDPDIRVFSRFDRLEKLLENGASVVLTPHITSPVEDGLVPNDHQMLQAGVFNLGFVAMRRSEESIKYSQWWGRRLTTMCVSDVANGLFTDQKWCDLAPCFLDNLSVLKDPGYNVAYWNLFQREIKRSDEGQWIVNGAPLVFFHFSGVNVDKPTTVSKHQNRLVWEDIKHFSGLFESYFASLLQYGWHQTKLFPYAYSKTKDGIFMSGILRKFYRLMHPSSKRPMSKESGHELVLESNRISEHFGRDGPLSNLMVLIHQTRQDLQVAFNLSTAEGRLGFYNWFVCSAEREYGLSKEFMPVYDGAFQDSTVKKK